VRKAVDCNMSSSSFIMSRTKRTWGAGHISRLDTANNIGLLYGNQGKMEEAEAMYLRALQGKEKAWGVEHTSTLETVSSILHHLKLQSSSGRHYHTSNCSTMRRSDDATIPYYSFQQELS
jgi:Tetratricopeptide repeat